MLNYYCLLLCCFLCTIKQINTESLRYVYNSTDLSYLSNGIQFPVPTTEDIDPIVLDGHHQHHWNLTEIEWLTSLYDHKKWIEILPKLDNNNCYNDLIHYINELQNGTLWALKMYDASGRYSGQFFFGNDYWVGSKTLCSEIVKTDYYSEVPSFGTRFFMAKVRINIDKDLTPVTRQLNIGECLPSSCTLKDVRLLLGQQRNYGVSLNLIGLRQIPGQYSFVEDTKFQIVGGAALFVAILTIIASIIEIVTKKKTQQTKIDVELENNNNNVTHDTKIGKETHDTTTRKPTKPGLLLRLLLSFSAINNGRKILNIEKLPASSIRCIHGLRFFSIAWIIMVHTYLEVFAIADNKNLRTITERTFTYQTIANATFSVDTFFFISGLLVTITYFRTAKRESDDQQQQQQQQQQQKPSTCRIFQNNLIKFGLLLIYRFLRLTPAYLFVLGINEIILRYLHNNSVFSPAIIDHISCSNYWWRNMLYINNFYPQTEFCMLWSWYIANDTQFYIIATILLLIAVRGEKHLKFAGIILGVFMVVSWITTFIIAMEYRYTIRVEEPFALFDQLYDKPWIRIGPYLIGMLTGYFLFRTNMKIRLTTIVVIVGWLLALCCLCCLVYGVGSHGLVVPTSAFYASLGHTAWGLALAWITIACCCGYGGPLNGLFSCKFFLPLSRLTYCAYLIHPVFMCFSSFLLDGPLHLHENMVIVIYLGNMLVSFAAAFFISLGFEAPVVNLLKIIF